MRFLLGVFRSGVMWLISLSKGGEDVGLVHVAPFVGAGDDADIVSGGAGWNWAGGPGGCLKRVD